MTDVPYKRGNLDTDTHTWRMLCEYEDRDWGDVATSEETSKIARNHQMLGERLEQILLIASEGTSLVDTFISDFQPSGP